MRRCQGAIFTLVLLVASGLGTPELTDGRAVQQAKTEPLPEPRVAPVPPQMAPERITQQKASREADPTPVTGWRQINGLWTEIPTDDGSEPQLPQSWACIHRHEGSYSSGAHKGDVHYGGFRLGSYEWRHAGGLATILPNQATPQEQFKRALIYHDQAKGFGPWATRTLCGL